MSVECKSLCIYVSYRSTGSDLGVFAVSCVLLDIMAMFGEVDIFTTVRQLRPHFIMDQVSAINFLCPHKAHQICLNIQ